jgi:SPP1 family predicted phage head-tail adaptor
VPAIRQVGRFRHRIDVLSRPEGLDSLGRATRSGWVVTRRPWGEWRDLSGQERELARQIVADVSVLVTIRHLPGLDTQSRLRHDGKTVEIRAVLDPDGHGRQMLVYCSEAK